jgi:hypothetical protein
MARPFPTPNGRGRVRLRTLFDPNGVHAIPHGRGTHPPNGSPFPAPMELRACSHCGRERRSRSWKRAGTRAARAAGCTGLSMAMASVPLGGAPVQRILQLQADPPPVTLLTCGQHGVGQRMPAGEFPELGTRELGRVIDADHPCPRTGASVEIAARSEKPNLSSTRCTGVKAGTVYVRRLLSRL